MYSYTERKNQEMKRKKKKIQKKPKKILLDPPHVVALQDEFFQFYKNKSFSWLEHDNKYRSNQQSTQPIFNRNA